IYDRKVKVSPTLDVPLPENIPSVIFVTDLMMCN
ncbi:integrase, partial [Shigella dysenteriae]|nr:integrase [Shigella dysenteriae]EFX9663665.1 integrase [Shigella dysenteriae]EFX9816858.1 integrase [Shigella dysenteriae]EFY0241367.1 integrase [Shigella dysenteriae]EFZ0015834.1 integrase [Shigella dysenteriae]